MRKSTTTYGQPRKRSPWLLLTTLLTIFVLLAAACGGDDDDDNSSGADTSQATESTAGDSGSSDDGGATDDQGSEPAASTAPSTLTVLLPSPPISLDPARNGSGINSAYSGPAYAPLVFAAADGSLTPALAESFGYVGEGNTEFEVKLREGLTFSDGTPLDSTAVKTWIEYFKVAGGPFSNNANLLTSIETPDDLTVVFKTDAPNPDIGFYLSQEGLLGLIGNPTRVESDPDSFGTVTDGIGEYVLDTDATIQGSEYVFVANDNYPFPEEREFEKIVMRVVEDANTAYQAVKTGEAHLMQGDETLVDQAQADGLGTFVVALSFDGMHIQDRDGQVVEALGDVRVRQALNYAVDRPTLALAIGGTVGTPLQQIIPPGFPGHVVDLESAYTYDPDRARELLAEAGYPDGFEMSAVLPGFAPNTVRLAEAVAQQFAEVGVTLTLDTKMTFPDYARAQESGEYPSTFLSWGYTTPFVVFNQLARPTGIVNPFKSSNDTINSLFEEAASLPPGADATALWEQITSTLHEEGWFAPVLTGNSVWITAPELGGVDITISYAQPNLFTWEG